MTIPLFELSMLLGVGLALAKAYGWKISINRESDEKIIFRPPPPGAPAGMASFEVPKSEEGERFIIDTLNKAHTPAKDEKEKEHPGQFL